MSAAVVDTRTPNLGLPLPDRENDLSGDVGRLRKALSLLDGEVARLEAQLNSAESGLPSIAASFDALREHLAALQRILPAKADIADQERFQAAVRRDVPVGMAATLRRLKLNAQLGLGI